MLLVDAVPESISLTLPPPMSAFSECLSLVYSCCDVRPFNSHRCSCVNIHKTGLVSCTSLGVPTIMGFLIEGAECVTRGQGCPCASRLSSLGRFYFAGTRQRVGYLSSADSGMLRLGVSPQISPQRALTVSSYITSSGTRWRASKAQLCRAASRCLASMQGAHLQCPTTVSNW
jgi:hypothetical protein